MAHDTTPTTPTPTPTAGTAAQHALNAAARAAADELLVCDNDACTNANSPRETCTCTRCHGAGHGLDYEAQRARGRAAWRARTDLVRDDQGRSTGFTRAMLDAMPDDDVF
jgi:hypothetical protein